MEFIHEKNTQLVLDNCQEFINEYQKLELFPDRLKYIEKSCRLIILF